MGAGVTSAELGAKGKKEALQRRVFYFNNWTSSFFPAMLKLSLQTALRQAAQKLPGLTRAPPTALLALRLPGTGRQAPGCWMGTHGRNEPREPLNSPKRAKEFIYRLHPNERTCLLKELQSFESIAIAQGRNEKSRATCSCTRGCSLQVTYGGEAIRGQSLLFLSTCTEQEGFLASRDTLSSVVRCL